MKLTQFASNPGVNKDATRLEHTSWCEIGKTASFSSNAGLCHLKVKPYLTNELHQEQFMDMVSSPFPEHSDPMCLSPLFPLEGKLLAWSPLVALLCSPSCPALPSTTSPGSFPLLEPVKSYRHWAKASQGSKRGTPGQRHPIDWALLCHVTSYRLKSCNSSLLGKSLLVLVFSCIPKPL